MAAILTAKSQRHGTLPSVDRARLNEAQRLQKLGRMAEAEAIFRNVLQRHSGSYDARMGLGQLACQLGRYADGVELLRAAIQADSDQPDAYVNLARALYRQGQPEAALASIQMALDMNAEDDGARLEAASWLVGLKRHADAQRMLAPMLHESADDARSLFRAGRAAQLLGDSDHALNCLLRASAGGKADPEVHLELGDLLMELQRPAEAAEAFARVPSSAPQSGSAVRGQTRALMRLRRFNEALQLAQRAVATEPESIDAWNLHGAALSCVNRLEEASDSLRRALQMDPNQRPALVNLANVLQTMHRNEDAALVFERLLAVWPDCEFVKSRLLHCKMLICDWLNRDRLLAEIERDIDRGLPAAEPFGLQGYCASPERLQRAARVYASLFHPDRSSQVPAPLVVTGAADRKIRIGYVSGEFRQQATSILIVHLLELHDRDRFEVFAFDNGHADQSSYRQRIEAAVTELVPISQLSDAEALQAIRQRGVDILVNLNGYFGNARTDLFSLRPAPVQVNFLGFPGTLGVPYMDYVVADRIVLPCEHRPFYDEAVVEMPDSYQPNDARRPVAEGVVTRHEHGLPAGGFVFCNFNNAYKITPEVFSVWMRLLQKVPGSVLWLLQAEDAEAVVSNLKAEAQRRGVAGHRLVFAPHVSVEQHVARLRLADLVLDTLPYNAHTTGSDALCAGVPMVTCVGTSFAGRVGASLLSAAGLPQLITTSLADYEALSLHLATTPEAWGAVRQQLLRNLQVAPLFNTDRFRLHLEAAYEQMYERACQGLSPSPIELQPIAPVTTAAWSAAPAHP